MEKREGGGQGKKIYKSSENNQRGEGVRVKGNYWKGERGGLGLRGIVGNGRKGGNC